MDEASVLENAIRYLKYLQERVDTLEKQSRKPALRVKKSQLMVDDEGSSSNEPQSAPSIEARVCDKHVLLRICCGKRKGVLVKLLSEVEKLHLGVVNTSVVPFGSSAHDITIIAESMVANCSLKSKGRLRKDATRNYFQQLISAIDFCHSPGVYHRDLKPENLLLDEEGNLKVTISGKEKEFNLAVEEIVQNLNAVLQRAV